MKKITLISIICTLLLSGCWDERLFKDLTLVRLIGVEGELGKLNVHYTFTAVTNGAISYSSVEGSGVSMRETRLRCKSKDE